MDSLTAPDDQPRRRLAIPAGGYALIKRLAAAGARESYVARKLGLSPAGWTRIKERNPKALASFLAGREELELELIARVKEPELPADYSVAEGIALMRARQHGATVLGNSLFGWTRPDTDTATPVSVTITLPGAMSPGEYAKTITGIAITAGKSGDE